MSRYSRYSGVDRLVLHQTHPQGIYAADARIAAEERQKAARARLAEEARVAARANMVALGANPDDKLEELRGGRYAESKGELEHAIGVTGGKK